MFTIAAIWNWILAVAFLVLPRIDINYLYLAGDTIPPTMLWFDSFMGLVFIFGIGFYLVSLNIEENHGFIKIACFEKVWVFIIPFYYFLIAQATIWVVAFVTVDLIFGFLFMEDLRAITRK
jgi:hypothetical protein